MDVAATLVTPLEAQALHFCKDFFNNEKFCYFKLLYNKFTPSISFLQRNRMEPSLRTVQTTPNRHTFRGIAGLVHGLLNT